MIHHRLEKLNQLGQSVWYDNLSREMIASGELKKNIDLGVSGLTSNPSIFEKAISSSEIYDDSIRAVSYTHLTLTTILLV